MNSKLIFRLEKLSKEFAGCHWLKAAMKLNYPDKKNSVIKIHINNGHIDTTYDLLVSMN